MAQATMSLTHLACMSCDWVSASWGGEDTPRETIDAGVAAKDAFDEHEASAHPDGASARWVTEEQTTMNVMFVVNADPQDAWEIIDHWIGLTAPEEVVEFRIAEEQE
jgi:hypothetical protein